MDSNELQRSLGRVEGKLDSLIDSINKHFEDDKRNFTAIDTKVQKLEKKVWYASGFVGALMFLVNYFKPFSG